MANCRCDEISRQEERIRVLSRAQSRLADANNPIQQMDASLTALTSEYAGSFTSEGITRLSTNTKSINASMKTVRTVIAGRIASQKSAFESELGNMRSEDWKHHEEERLKAEEAAAKAVLNMKTVK